MAIRLLNPVQEPAITGFSPTARLDSLVGKALGLYGNGKLNAALLLEFVAEDLAADGAVVRVRGTYDPGRIMNCDEWGAVDACDAAVLANGDCGACSTSGIANAIELEKRGIPAVLIGTRPFVEAVRTSAMLRGMPQIAWAVVDHPIARLNEEELRSRAVDAARQFRAVILAEPLAQED